MPEKDGRIESIDDMTCVLLDTRDDITRLVARAATYKRTSRQAGKEV